TLGGQFHYCIAALDLTGTPTAWNPGANDTVRTLLVKGGAVYAGGSFTQLGGQLRAHLGAVRIDNAAPTAWDPAPRYDVLALAQDATNIVAGGRFNALGAGPQSYVAGFDATSALDVPPIPSPLVSGLERVTPNPAAGPVTIAFTLGHPS